MAILKVARSIARSGPSFRKALYLAERRGTPYASKWPIGRGKSGNPVVRHNQEWFAQAQAAYKVTAPQIIATAIQATAGTPFLPRDLLTAAMAGRLFSITVEGEGTLYPVAARIDVSQSIDILGNKEGQLLIRTNDLWLQLPAGKIGQPLISQGVGKAPEWQDANIGDFDTMLTSSFQNENNTDNMSMQGNFFRPGFNITVLAVWASIDLVAASTYHVILARLDGQDIVEVLYRSGGFVAPAAGKTFVLFELPVPIALIQDQTYMAAIYRSDGAATTNLKMRRGTGQIMGFPAKANESSVRFASNNPVVGDTVDVFGTTKVLCCHLIYNM